jgi:hypothetical protein
LRIRHLLGSRRNHRRPGRHRGHRPSHATRRVPQAPALVLDVCTPLLARGQDVARELVIFYRGDQLDHPHTASISLISKGRLDIPRAAFDGQPLRLDLGVPVIAILKASTAPDRTPPVVRPEASALIISPALIGKRETIAISVLTDGQPKLGRLPQSLENVDIKRGDPRDSLTGQSRTRLIAILVLILIAVVTIWVAYLMTRHTQPGSYGPGP